MKAILIVLFSTILTIYNGVVLSTLWRWAEVSDFIPIPEPSVVQMVGVTYLLYWVFAGITFSINLLVGEGHNKDEMTALGVAGGLLQSSVLTMGLGVVTIAGWF